MWIEALGCSGSRQFSRPARVARRRVLHLVELFENPPKSWKVAFRAFPVSSRAETEVVTGRRTCVGVVKGTPGVGNSTVGLGLRLLHLLHLHEHAHPC
jgi:hypothetical protein